MTTKDLTAEQLQRIKAYWQGSIHRREHALDADQKKWALGQMDGMERTLNIVFGDFMDVIEVAKKQPDLDLHRPQSSEDFGQH
jgi:hypothetical protein